MKKNVILFIALISMGLAVNSQIAFIHGENLTRSGQSVTDEPYSDLDQSVDFHQFDDITIQPLPGSLTLLLLGSSIIGVAIARRNSSR